MLTNTRAQRWVISGGVTKGTRGLRRTTRAARRMYNLGAGELLRIPDMGTGEKTIMASRRVRAQRTLRFLRTRARELKMIGKALLSTKHPVLVHIIPMRRCNLDCGYCNEYDQVSKPVPIEEMKRRLDYLAAMGTSIVTISGGEALL